MKVVHHVSFNKKREAKGVLSELGVPMKEGAILCTLDIEEGHELWPEVNKIISEYNLSDLTTTKFTSGELSGALWLVMRCDIWGYPMPDSNFGYLTESYDLSDYHEASGMGALQVRDFRMKPKIAEKRKDIFQLNWVPDVFFCNIDVWKNVFMPFGIKCRSVINHASGELFDSIVQLVPQGIQSFNIDETKASHEKIDGRVKYHAITNGYYPSLAKPKDVTESLFVSEEYWGSGGLAYKATVISDKLYEKIKKHKVKGVRFIPVQS